MKDKLTTMPAAGIPHAAGCKRPAPVLRLSWKQEREAWCDGCGRAQRLDGQEVAR